MEFIMFGIYYIETHFGTFHAKFRGLKEQKEILNSEKQDIITLYSELLK